MVGSKTHLCQPRARAGRETHSGVLAPTGALSPQKAKTTTAAAPNASGGPLSQAHEFSRFCWISMLVPKQSCPLANGPSKGHDAREPRVRGLRSLKGLGVLRFSALRSLGVGGLGLGF